MSRKKKKYIPAMECVAYLSTTGPLWETEKREQKQERYIREYAKAHNIEVVGIIRRNGLGQGDVNEQFSKITHLIRQKRVEGVIVANMMAIAVDIPDAYYKVGKVKAAGGVIVTVDEGELRMNVKERVSNEK
ncbi:resolvase [Enterocloster bolteae]|uniref:resolvase n=1 Tax=Enterocloster bolteae TaxID=208479 RepID=UPI00210C147B|nr:resolvase [Enterocloster bolteae]MCQ4754622.1 resolvase [Enterocloster bolteae]